MINFPVIRKFDIQNYQLYSKNIKEGVTHSMKGGVHLIIGVNGLGKTTLLNALFRVLVGPKDIPKGDQKPLGSTQHTLSPWRSNKFFSGRVSDGALNATIDAEITFGNQSICVRRKLSTLEVVSLSLNEKPLNASQDEYEAQVVSLSNCADYVDFYSIVKYLIFFMEDRSELVWDYRSQFEMFRILFFDRESSLKAVEYYDIAQRKDSKYRNIHASLASVKEDIKSYENNDESRAAYAAEKAQLRGLQEEVVELNEEIGNLEYFIAKIKQTRAALVIDHREIQYSIEHDQHSLYTNFFPKFDSTLKYIFSNVIADGGCLACGSKNSEAGIAFKKKIENHECPICDSGLKDQENTANVTSNVELINKRIFTKTIRANKILEAISAQDEILKNAANDMQEKKQQLSDSFEKMQASRRRIRKLSANGSPVDQSLEDLQKILDIREAELTSIAAERDAATKEYVQILDQYRADIKDKMELLKKRFAENCSQLLAERVFLTQGLDKRKIGQSGEFIDFPCFEISMTSGVFDQSPAIRENALSVSESQREFIDLAFRLSLIDVVTNNRDIPSMIVMETPEASLDSMFVFEASTLFKRYSSGKNNRNVFLASTNLTDGLMIPALLGILKRPDSGTLDSGDQAELNIKDDHQQLHAIPVEERSDHIVNLLERSAPNRILRMHRDAYQQMYKSAVYGDLAETMEL